MKTETSFQASAPEIGDALGVTPRTIRLWVEAGELPRLERGRFDMAWATWLAAGRKVSVRWSGKTSATIAVAAGWLQAVGLQPSDDDVEAFGELFKRNGMTGASAMQALGAAQVRMGRE